MTEKILSVFIDESGDFGTYDHHAPNYYVAIVMHEQLNDIKANIRNLNEHIINLGYEIHAIHTGPIIRREAFYINDLKNKEGRCLIRYIILLENWIFITFVLRLKKWNAEIRNKIL